MFGFNVSCEKCGTDRPDVVYYCGPSSTHCGDCWMVIVAAEPNFSIDAMMDDIKERLSDSGPLAATGSKIGAFTEVVPLYNSGISA